jgi:hypothetical protein
MDLIGVSRKSPDADSQHPIHLPLIGDTTMKLRKPILLLALCCALPALAAEPKMEAELQALRAYCKPDIERLCPKVEPGGGRLKACLKMHKEEISVGCAQALQKLKKEL